MPLYQSKIEVRLSLSALKGEAICFFKDTVIAYNSHL